MLKSHLSSLLKPLPRLLVRPLALLPTPLWQQPLEKLCQWSLRQPLTEGQFDWLEGRRIAIEVSDSDLRFTVSLSAGKLTIDDRDGAETTLSGDCESLLLLATRQEDPDTLFFQRRLQIRGNTELGLALKNELDGFDWQQLPLTIRHHLAAIGAVMRFASTGEPSSQVTT